MKAFFYILLSMFIFSVNAQVIPSSNRVDWSNAGYQMPGIAASFQVNVKNFGAVGDGITDDYQSIVNAIASLNGRYGVVNIPAGTYLLSNEIVLPDSVIIRGAGANQTFLKVNHTGSCFGVYGTPSNTSTSIVADFSKDSPKITVADPSLFSVGDYVEIRQDNGSWDIVPASWAVKVLGQISKVVAISGNSLFLEDKLRISMNASLNPDVRKVTPRQQIRIENMNIERTNTSTTAVGNTVLFSYAVNCRISGIESNKSLGSHCKINASSRIEVSGSYFHDANTYDGEGTKGYGIALDTHSSLCLITNNIFRHLRHAMMLKAGANGNVISYNYSREVFRNGVNENPSDNAGDISLHGHYAYANLIEGNIVQNIQIDSYWGPSGPYNTFFRNRTELYGILMDASNTNNSNFVGNEVLYNKTSFFFNVAFRVLGNGNVVSSNNVNNTITPYGTGTLSDMSYYLTAQPSFWNISDNWPSIGVSNSLNAGTIPAKARFLSQIYTVPANMPGLNTAVNTVNADVRRDFITNEAAVALTVDRNQIVIVDILDLSGRILRTETFRAETGANVFHINLDHLSKGIYPVRVKVGSEYTSSKIII